MVNKRELVTVKRQSKLIFERFQALITKRLVVLKEIEIEMFTLLNKTSMAADNAKTASYTNQMLLPMNNAYHE